LVPGAEQCVEQFAEIDRPALKALPTAPYQYAEWKKCRVAPDYHFEIADHCYSVPSRLIREQLEAGITDTTIEILHKGARVASHSRSHARRRHTTIPEHMPSAHRRYAAVGFRTRSRRRMCWEEQHVGRTSAADYTEQRGWRW
jgi:transposase